LYVQFKSQDCHSKSTIYIQAPNNPTPPKAPLLTTFDCFLRKSQDLQYIRQLPCIPSIVGKATLASPAAGGAAGGAGPEARGVAVAVAARVAAAGLLAVAVAKRLASSLARGNRSTGAGALFCRVSWVWSLNIVSRVWALAYQQAGSRQPRRQGRTR
jgi:hypothetical protein